MSSVDAVRQAIREAALPKIATPAVLTPGERRIAEQTAWRLRLPSTQEIAEAMRIEIPLPQMPEPRVYERWQAPMEAPSWMQRRRQRGQALRAEREGRLVVVREPEIRPARDRWDEFVTGVVRNEIDQGWQMQVSMYLGTRPPPRQTDLSSGIYDQGGAMDLAADRLDLVSFGGTDCSCPLCTGQIPLWALMGHSMGHGAEESLSEEERIEQAGRRWQNRTPQDFLDYSGTVLADWEAGAASWSPEPVDGPQDPGVRW